MPIWPSTLLVDSLVGLVCSGLFSACWEANLGRFLFVCFIKYRLIFLPISHDYLKSGFMIPLIYFLKVLCFSVLQPKTRARQLKREQELLLVSLGLVRLIYSTVEMTGTTRDYMTGVL